MTNHCTYDCKYCINRVSNDVKRATFTPEEICQLTVEFYKRNYIEGLFLSSGVLKNPTYTMERMCETLLLLRTKYHFNGYIHVKTIPGVSDELLAAAGYLADRISVNMELPTQESLRTLAPNKTMKNILNPMGKVQSTIASHRMAIGKSAYMERSRGNQFLSHGIFSDNSHQVFREKLESQSIPPQFKNISDKNSTAKNIQDVFSQKENDMTSRILTWENACQLAPLDMSDLKRSFAPAGQSTQMIIGATGESDYTLLQTTQALYQGYDLKRVFYSAYIPLNEDKVLPQIGTPPPLLREHRLYQADWLLRFYGFQADELLSEAQPDFNELLDPKCDWALRHLEPRSDVIMLVGTHFADRMPSEHWMIIDDNRKTACVHPKDGENYLRYLTDEEFQTLRKTEEYEDEFTDMWKTFFHAISIKQRENYVCQRNLFPIWKRKHAVEFK